MADDLSIVERMKVVREFDRADEVQFDRYASKAPFSAKGDCLSRTAYTQPADKEGPTYTYSVIFAEDSDRIVSSTIIAKDAKVTTTILDELALHSSNHWAARL